MEIYNPKHYFSGVCCKQFPNFPNSSPNYRLEIDTYDTININVKNKNSCKINPGTIRFIDVTL